MKRMFCKYKPVEKLIRFCVGENFIFYLHFFSKFCIGLGMDATMPKRVEGYEKLRR